MSKRFKLYNVDIKYIRNLHNIDDNVPSVSPQISKQKRPFLGIIVMVNGSKYCIPLKIFPSDKDKDRQWKILCAKELNWCQEHQNEIERLANELYRMYVSQEPFGKRQICLNFPALERECNKTK